MWKIEQLKNARVLLVTKNPALAKLVENYYEYVVHFQSIFVADMYYSSEKKNKELEQYDLVLLDINYILGYHGSQPGYKYQCLGGLNPRALVIRLAERYDGRYTISSGNKFIRTNLIETIDNPVPVHTAFEIIQECASSIVNSGMVACHEQLSHLTTPIFSGKLPLPSQKSDLKILVTCAEKQRHHFLEAAKSLGLNNENIKFIPADNSCVSKLLPELGNFDLIFVDAVNCSVCELLTLESKNQCDYTGRQACIIVSFNGLSGVLSEQIKLSTYFISAQDSSLVSCGYDYKLFSSPNEPLTETESTERAAFRAFLYIVLGIAEYNNVLRELGAPIMPECMTKEKIEENIAASNTTRKEKCESKQSNIAAMSEIVQQIENIILRLLNDPSYSNEKLSIATSACGMDVAKAVITYDTSDKIYYENRFNGYGNSKKITIYIAHDVYEIRIDGKKFLNIFDACAIENMRALIMRISVALGENPRRVREPKK